MTWAGTIGFATHFLGTYGGASEAALLVSRTAPPEDVLASATAVLGDVLSPERTLALPIAASEASLASAIDPLE